jgi:phosphatidylinositol alpha-1,6-mannosyltransferase
VLEELDGRPPGPERIEVVPNAVEADHFMAPRDVGVRPWHAVPYTLSIGEVKERKGHHLSLGAWCAVAEEFPALHHFVVGNRAGDAYERGLHERVAAAGLTDRVHFLGNVTEDEKIDLLQRCELFVHTPVTAADGGFEGFGLVYLEVSACGAPVIGTLGCGAEDAIVEGATGLLVPQRVDAVEDALEKLLGDGALRAAMGQRGRDHARANTWEKNARAVLDLYAEVLGRGAPALARGSGA